MSKDGPALGDGEAFGRRFPARIFFGQLGQQTARIPGGRLQKVHAGESIFRHDLILQSCDAKPTAVSYTEGKGDIAKL
jgi:hypothetical protein